MNAGSVRQRTFGTPMSYMRWRTEQGVMAADSARRIPLFERLVSFPVPQDPIEMSFSVWALVIGALLITMALAGSLMKRLPVSASMLYLVVGYGLGTAGWGLMAPDPHQVAAILERVSEVALLISLFSVGLKLGLPFSSRHWRLPLRLAFVSMALTVGLITLVGVFLLDLPLGAAVLLGGILAPTDPVLASDVQVDEPHDSDRLRFSLTGEGGLNDGAAFPFVMLGLGLLGRHELGAGGWRWLGLDVFWALAGGLLIGAIEILVTCEEQAQQHQDEECHLQGSAGQSISSLLKLL